MLKFKDTISSDCEIYSAYGGSLDNLKFFNPLNYILNPNPSYEKANNPPTNLEQVIFEVYKQSNFIVDIGISLRWANAGSNITAVSFDFPLIVSNVNMTPNIRVFTNNQFVVIPVTSLPNNYDTIVSPIKKAAMFENNNRVRPKDGKSYLYWQSGVLKIFIEADHNESYSLSGLSTELRYQTNILPFYPLLENV